MTQLKVVLDQNDIECALKEYCENVLNMQFKGMIVRVEAPEEGVNFPQEAVLIAEKIGSVRSVAAALEPYVPLDIGGASAPESDIPF